MQRRGECIRYDCERRDGVRGRACVRAHAKRAYECAAQRAVRTHSLAASNARPTTTPRYRVRSAPDIVDTLFIRIKKKKN